MTAARRLDASLTGVAVASLRRFYKLLPAVPREGWPELLLGLGYNFESYDMMFALMAANVQGAMEATDYTARFRAMQALLQPFCSEYGVEAGRPLAKTHRELYARFYHRATGTTFPERYPDPGAHAWVDLARRWSRRMSEALACTQADAAQRAKFNLAYHWAVERLSVDEFALMREAWRGLGLEAPYLDAHCEVEGEHSAWARDAVLALAAPDEAVVARAIQAHEADLAGYYDDLAALVLGAGLSTTAPAAR